MVERSLSMREVRGSMPRFSNFLLLDPFFLFFASGTIFLGHDKTEETLRYNSYQFVEDLVKNSTHETNSRERYKHM